MKEETLIRDLSKLEKEIDRNHRYADCESDRDMKKQYLKDANDLDAIADAIRAGDNKKASRLIYNLDTLVRDQIPARLYNEIMKNL